MVKRRVQTRLERKHTGPEEWLVVTQRPLSDDRPLEPRASRDATDQDAHHRYQYRSLEFIPIQPSAARV